MDSHRALSSRILRLACASLLLLAFAVPALAQGGTAAPRPASILDDFQFQEETRKGLGYLYNMDFAAADATFSVIADRHPDHPASPFLQALVPWWTIQLEPGDESQDEAFLAAMDRGLEISEGRPAAADRERDVR